MGPESSRLSSTLRFRRVWRILASAAFVVLGGLFTLPCAAAPRFLLLQIVVFSFFTRRLEHPIPPWARATDAVSSRRPHCFKRPGYHLPSPTATTILQFASHHVRAHVSVIPASAAPQPSRNGGITRGAFQMLPGDFDEDDSDATDRLPVYHLTRSSWLPPRFDYAPWSHILESVRPPTLALRPSGTRPCMVEPRVTLEQRAPETEIAQHLFRRRGLSMFRPRRVWMYSSVPWARPEPSYPSPLDLVSPRSSSLRCSGIVVKPAPQTPTGAIDVAANLMPLLVAAAAPPPWTGERRKGGRRQRRDACTAMLRARGDVDGKSARNPAMARRQSTKPVACTATRPAVSPAFGCLSADARGTPTSPFAADRPPIDSPCPPPLHAPQSAGDLRHRPPACLHPLHTQPESGYGNAVEPVAVLSDTYQISSALYPPSTSGSSIRPVAFRRIG
ncbi:hypothetical protein C8R45DRAFT_1096007 [Mycena sanguinolenta]|nr:hypothetical protein C8R45DRAFT_1096007 [Mycena sanguinolenta]